jgi:transposase
MENTNRKFIEVKPYMIKELAALYGVSRETFGRWISKFKDELGEKNGLYFSIPQVKMIFKKLDLPSVIELKEDGENLMETKKAA